MDIGYLEPEALHLTGMEGKGKEGKGSHVEAMSSEFYFKTHLDTWRGPVLHFCFFPASPFPNILSFRP